MPRLTRATELPFSPPNAIASDPNGADHVVAADLDGDGDLDAVTIFAGGSVRKLQWHENTAGDGSVWTTHTLHDGGDDIRDVSTGDVDGDGDLDLLVAFASPTPRVDWYENDMGDGSSWTLHQVALIAGGAGSVRGADLDGDGDLDLLVAGFFGGAVRWHENTAGDGSIWLPHDIATGLGTIVRANAADLDSDGDLDTLVVRETDGVVLWVENTIGDASQWQAHMVDSPSDSPIAATSADLDHDGDLDLLMATVSGPSWYENAAGDASLWTGHAIDGGGHRIDTIEALDFDGDGDLDAVAASTASGLALWYENESADAQNWRERTVSSVAGQVSSATAVDVDGDGDLDAMTSSRVSAAGGAVDGTVQWFRNDTLHRSAALRTYDLLEGGLSFLGDLALGDIDRDGYVDVVATGSSSGSGLVWWRNLSDGTYSAPLSIGSMAPTAVIQVEIADIDGDGSLDVVTGTNASEMRWWHNEEGDGSAWSYIDIAPVYANRIGHGDIDGDGDLDLIASTVNPDFSEPTVFWFENTSGDGTTWVQHSTGSEPEPNRNIGEVRAVDMDGDGDLDMHWLRGIGSYWLENDAGDGSTWTAHSISDASVIETMAVDIDGDGDLDTVTADYDLTWHENTDGTGTSWLPHFVAKVSYSGPGGVDRQSYSVGAADLDADGDIDLMVGYLSSQSPRGAVWFENLDGSGGAWQRHQDGDAQVRRARFADLDGDGDLDAAISTTAGSFAWLENVGGQFALAVPETPPIRALSGGSTALPPLTVHHRGRAADADLELRSLNLFFDDGAMPLSTAQLAALVDRLSIHLDDGDGTFQPGTDPELLSLSELPLVDGIFTHELPGGQPATRIAHGAPKTYFLVAQWSVDAADQIVDGLRIDLLPGMPWTAVDVDFGLSLTLEAPSSGPVLVEINDPPVALPSQYNLQEEAHVTYFAPGALQGATDEEGDPLTAVLEAGPIHARVFNLSPDGAIVYQAVEHWSGIDAFTFRASDGLQESEPASVTLVVEARADTPSLSVASVASPGDGAIPLEISAALVDQDGSEQLTVSIADLPPGSTLSAGTDAGGGRWTLGASDLSDLTLSLPRGLGGHLEFPVTATATETSNGDSRSRIANLSINVGTDLAVDVMESVDPVIAGSGSGNLTYEVQVENVGPWEATGIELSAMTLLDSGVVVDSATPSTGTFDAGTWSLGNLAPGATARLDVVLTVGASAMPATDTITLTATLVDVDQPDSAPGNEEALARTSIGRQADLAVILSDGVEAVVPGGTTTYTLEARNLGPSDAAGARVSDLLPLTLACTWACTPSDAATCSPGPVDGDLDDTIDLAALAVATYTATCQIAVDSDGPIVNLATILAPDDTSDAFPDNDSSADEDSVLDLDWGDAPDGTIEARWAYPTRFEDDGARHGVVAEFVMGTALDSEEDGLPSLEARGDDLDSVDGSDDEDGITFLSPWVACEQVTLGVQVSRPGFLDAWVDFDGDGAWSADEERIFDNYEIFPSRPDPVREVQFDLPCSAHHGETFARVRYSSGGGLLPTGVAADGEVEDYLVSITAVADLGIAVEHGGETAIPGTSFEQTVTVTNLGSSPVDTALIESPLALGLTGGSWTCTPSAGSDCTPGPISGDLSDPGSLAPGGVLTYRLSALLDSDAVGSLTTTAAVTVPSGVVDPFADNDTSSDTSLLTPGTDLGIVLDDGAESAIPGMPISYQLMVSNSGPSKAVGATVELVVPPVLRDLEWTCTASPGSVCTPGPVAGDLLDTVSLPSGGSLSYLLSAEIDSAALGQLVLAASTTTAAGAFDPNSGNNSDEDTDLLTPQTDLELTKTDDADPWIPGTPLVYTLSVFNRGPSDALAIVVTDVLPPGLVAVATLGCAEDPLATPDCTLGSLAVGAARSYTLQVEVAPSPPGEVTNHATVAGEHPDVDPTDDEAEESTTLDAVSPRVTGFVTAGETDLTDCGTIRESVNAILVAFSEEMDHEPDSPRSAVMPENYRLVAAHPGQDFETERCEGGTGSDTVIEIDHITYSNSESPDGPAAMLHPLAPALVDGLYRLMVCGTVADLAGNPLDGDGGIGSERQTTFRVDRFNLLAASHFDTFDPEACGLGDWGISHPEGVELDPEDAADSPLSGSAHGLDPMAGLDLVQCADLESQSMLTMGAAIRIDADPDAAHGVALEARFFQGPECTGPEVDQRIVVQVVLGGTGDWMRLSGRVSVPDNSQSVRYRVLLDTPFGDPLEGYVDDTFLGTGSPIFGDGFESGDATSWSVVVP